MAARLDVEINASGARRGGRQAENALNRVGQSADKADSSLKLFNKSLLIGGAVTVFTASLAKATQSSILFADSLAEVSTLLDDLPGELDTISDAAKRQAIEFGAMPTDQLKSFYQIISAGAENSTEATETLTAANKLAVGGVTSVTIAADGLTTAWNVYKDEIENVTELSDALFVGMKAGKTTIGELSSGIGKVAPLAAKAGVSFDELIASVSSLTKGGISTVESITGMRAVLAAIVKPSQEASKIAKGLGIEFNAAGLEAKGLAGFLADLEEKTEGNTDTIAKLFGGVEALVPILALTGKGAQSFSDILEDMKEKAGATETAFNKMAASPGFQIKRLLAAVAVIAIEAGDALSSILAPAATLVVDNLDLITAAAKVAGVTLTAAFGVQIIDLIGTQLVNALKLASAGVNFLTAATAANPWGAIAVAITASLSALIFFSDQIKLTADGAITLQDVFVAVWDKIKDGVVLITTELLFAVDSWVKLWNTAADAITSLFSGNVDEAKKWFQLALELGPTTEVGKRAKELLNSHNL